MAPLKGFFVPRKNPKHIFWWALSRSNLDQVWSTSLEPPGWLGAPKGHFWPFLASLAASGTPQRPSLTREKDQTHCPRCVLASIALWCLSVKNKTNQFTFWKIQNKIIGNDYACFKGADAVGKLDRENSADSEFSTLKLMSLGLVTFSKM